MTEAEKRKILLAALLRARYEPRAVTEQKCREALAKIKAT